jgi:hypothetical protein
MSGNLRRRIPGGRSVSRLLIAVLAGGVGFLAVVVYVLTGHVGPPSPLPDDPDRLILYSLDGRHPEPDEDRLAEAKPKAEYLYHFPVLGKLEVTDARQRREILAAVRRAIRNPDKAAACFFPRHAVRAVKGGETVDVVLCFECGNYAVYRGGATEWQNTSPLGHDGESLFDKILTGAGVPLAKKSHE